MTTDITRLPPGNHLPPLRIAGIVVELLFCTIIVLASIVVLYKVQHRTPYHLNLRLAVLNMYLFVPLTVIARSILIIDILTANTLLNGWVYVAAHGIYDSTMVALMYMQGPLVIERICATVYYRTYAYCGCTTTVVVIIFCWIWVILTAAKIATPSAVLIIIMFVTFIGSLIIIYAILIKINFARYNNGRATQSLEERHQLFENVKSLYPIISNLIIEVIFNIQAFICAFVMLYIVVPSDDIVVFEITDAVYNLTKEVLLFVYCMPFLVFSENRQKTNFLRKIDKQELNGTTLYFQQLQKQW